MSPWFRRRRHGDSPPVVSDAQAEPEPAAATAPEPAAVTAPESDPVEEDPTGPLSPDRLDRALKRLRDEIPSRDDGS